MPDQIQVTILEDGTIKVETGKVSGQNHMNAESFLREMSKLAGGPISVRKTHGLQQQANQQQKHVQQ